MRISTEGLNGFRLLLLVRRIFGAVLKVLTGVFFMKCASDTSGTPTTPENDRFELRTSFAKSA
eukprot:COSAG04_NODE_224_length_19624_cov_47.932855_16_plen_63_part_00